MPNKNLSEIARYGRKHCVEVKHVGDMAFDEMHQAVPMGEEKLEHLKTLRRDYSDKHKTMRLSCELSGEQIASRLVGLMRGSSAPNPFMERYADCIERAADFDDLSFVRVGKEAGAFEEAFQHFVAEFPGAPAVTVPEGEFFDMGAYLARVDSELRRSLLKRWAEIIRAKAQQ